VRALLLIAALAGIASLAAAQDPARREPEFDIVNLQAQASREVENDELAAVLAVELQGADAAALAAEANRRMQEALKTAAAFSSVKLRSGNYQTLPRYRQNERRIDGWQLTQELKLESRDFAAASALIGRLQQSLVLRSLSVRLAPETRRAAEDGVIAEALAAFRERAERVRESLKAAGYRIRQLDIGTGGAPGPVPLARAMAAAPGPVALEAGASQIAVTVSGSIQLR
jgi:predicted secreted protein